MDYLMMFIVFWFVVGCFSFILGNKNIVKDLIGVGNTDILQLMLVWPFIWIWSIEDYQQEARRKYADRVFDEMVLDRFKEQENAYRSDPSKYPQRR